MTWDVPTIGYAAARWLSYLAVFVIVGAVVFRWLVLPRAVRERGGDPAPLVARATASARLAAVVLAGSLLVRLYFQSRSMIEPEEPLTFEVIALVVRTRWGLGWMAQGLATLVTLVGWRALGARPDSRAGRALAILGAAGLVLAGPLIGHAVGLPAAGRIGYPLTVLHLAAGSAWLGTLGVLTIAALDPRRPASIPVSALVAAFSWLALRAGVLAIGAGVIVAWRYVGSIDALLSSDYGRTLLIKIATLAGVAGAGAYNWRVVLPRLRAGLPAPIRRTAAVEIAVGIVLLAITAVLVSLGAPGEHGE